MTTELRRAHVVLTRFNVRVGYSAGCNNDETWLAHRLSLFEEFCLPSLRRQSNQDFRWVVLLDSETPETVRRSVERLCEWPRIQPVYVKSFEAVDLDALVRTHVEQPVDVVVTSRIDNDDAFSWDYLARIGDAVLSDDAKVLNISEGFVYDAQRQRLYSRKHGSNPFLSVVEPFVPTRRLLTAFGAEHNAWSGVLPVSQVGGGPGWLVTVHGGNVSNDLSGTVRVPLSSAGNSFDLPGLPAEGDSILACHLDNLFGRLSESLTSTSRRLVSRARRRLHPDSGVAGSSRKDQRA